MKKSSKNKPHPSVVPMNVDGPVPGVSPMRLRDAWNLVQRLADMAEPHKSSNYFGLLHLAEEIKQAQIIVRQAVVEGRIKNFKLDDGGDDEEDVKPTWCRNCGERPTVERSENTYILKHHTPTTCPAEFHLASYRASRDECIEDWDEFNIKTLSRGK